MIYLFEGKLPLKTFNSHTQSKAPAICISRDVLQFVTHINATRIQPRPTVLTRYHIHFHNELYKAFESLNRTFVGNGFFRAALYKQQVYLEIMYKVNYSANYPDDFASHWFNTRQDVWCTVVRKRLTPSIIHDHYAELLKLGRIKEPI